MTKEFDEIKSALRGGFVECELYIEDGYIKTMTKTILGLKKQWLIQAIADYQTNFEQKHIAEAIEIARTEAIDQVLGLNETERFDGLNEHQKQILIDYHTRCLNELNKGVDNG